MAFVNLLKDRWSRVLQLTSLRLLGPSFTLKSGHVTRNFNVDELLTSLSRRRLLGALAISPLLGAAVSPLFGAASSSPSPLSRLCVQGRPEDTGSVYKVANIMSALNQLGGVRLMRCREPDANTVGWNTYVGLARAGVRFIFTLTAREPANTMADLRKFLGLIPGSIWAIEYPNEPDLNPVCFNGVCDARLGFRTGNAPSFMLYIQTMHKLFAADPLLKAIPIIASNDYMQRQQSSLTTLGNSHIYPAASANVTTVLAGFAQTVAAGFHRQGVITEWGRTTGGGAGNLTAPPVTVAGQADLIASDLAKIFADNTVAAVSLYELFSWPGSSEMNNFGLFNADLSPRPVVARIKALV